MPKSYRKYIILLPVVLLLATSGYLFGASFSSFEPETGIKTTNTSVTSDANASSGSGIRFDAPTLPPQCANGGSFLWSNLDTCGWPGPENTGPDLTACGGSLSSYTGSSTITTNNTTISCTSISQCLSIQATNVIISNVSISCSTGQTAETVNGTGVIKIESGASATISNAELNGSSSVHACVWQDGINMSVSAVDCYGVNDGIFNWNSGNFTIRDSYFHDFTAKTSNGHIDGYQTEGSSNGLIEHNTYYMNIIAGDPPRAGGGIDSAIAIWNSNISTSDITVRNNLITGGGFSIYAQDYSPSESNPVGGNSMQNIRFENNAFSTYLEGSCVGYFGIWFYRSSWTYQGGPTGGWGANGNVRDGNYILETGFDLDNGNPNGCN